MKLSDTSTSILQLTRELVRIPSRAGKDSPSRILHHLDAWFKSAGLPGSILLDEEGNPCAYYAETRGDGPLYILDACIDTADTGELGCWDTAAPEACTDHGSMTAWIHDPFAAEVDGNWLYGRGAGDSKVGVSIFSHIFRDIFQNTSKSLSSMTGRLGVLFDADEHTGGFGGIRRLLTGKRSISGVFIGYPGMDELVIGARGFYRVEIIISGTAGHTGMPGSGIQESTGTESSLESTSQSDISPRVVTVRDNAARTGAEFITTLYTSWEQFIAQLPEDLDFPFGPGMTVTEMHSGTAFSIIPDLCRIRIDFRLTGKCPASMVRDFLADVSSSVNRIAIEEIETWPAYTLPHDHQLAVSLGNAIRSVTGRKLPLIYCGPSNIGNYLASFNIPATCGFGVVCENFHAADERIRIDTIDTVYSVYSKCIEELTGLRK